VRASKLPEPGLCVREIERVCVSECVCVSKCVCASRLPEPGLCM